MCKDKELELEALYLHYVCFKMITLDQLWFDPVDWMFTSIS